jgi:hypothetical protein
VDNNFVINVVVQGVLMDLAMVLAKRRSDYEFSLKDFEFILLSI